MTLPTDARARKALPIFDVLRKYFPDAWRGVVEVAVKGNEQHNPGEPLHWAKGKSTDHPNCILRHLMEFEDIDEDGCYHADKVAWRALALAQMVREAHAAGMSYSEYIEVLKRNDARQAD